jgi:hypothetical protein
VALAEVVEVVAVEVLEGLGGEAEAEELYRLFQSCG